MTQCLITNTLLLHQEAWDLARKVSCPSETKPGTGKRVRFKPIVVDMLEVVSVPSGNEGTLQCWMDIQRGQYPNVSTDFIYC